MSCGAVLLGLLALSTFMVEASSSSFTEDETNILVVQIKNREQADSIADTYGFKNLGQVTICYVL